ncbi:PmoA family protein [Pirellulaceae bacterium]|jgi:hypothetical protein|nr:PmoA family protein [Pirellulaceae bacterium]
MTILLLMIFMIGSGTLFSMPQAVATDCTGNHVFSDRAPVIADQTFSFREKSDRIEIRLGNQLIASYLKKHSQLTRQGLINVTTQRGIPVTREFPPRLPEDRTPGQAGIDHQWMHPGIWISFGDLNGNDYWRMKSVVEFQKRIGPWSGGAGRGGFTVENRYLEKNKIGFVCLETTRFEFRRVAAGYVIFIQTAYHSDDRDFYFGDQEESGLAIRVASPLRVTDGKGTILNDRGQKNGEQIWGKAAKWFDYYGQVDDRQVGLLVASGSKNPPSTWLHARDYGLVVTNPFPRQPKERREPFIKTKVKKGIPFRLTYAVLVHDLPHSKELDREAFFLEMLTALDSLPPLEGQQAKSPR